MQSLAALEEHITAVTYDQNKEISAIMAALDTIQQRLERPHDEPPPPVDPEPEVAPEPTEDEVPQGDEPPPSTAPNSA